jgi:GTP-binding protein HflX
VVEEVLAELGAADRPTLLVFNKMDALAPEVAEALQARIRTLHPNAVFVSAVTEGGLEPLRRALLAAVRNEWEVVELRLSPADGRLLAELHRDGEILSQHSDDETLVVTARIQRAQAGRLRRAGILRDSAHEG